VERPDVEVLDAAERAPASRDRRRRWPLAAALAAVVVAALLVWPGDAPESGEDVAVALVGHTGSALTGQSFVRFHFSLSARGGDAEIQQVQLVLGGGRSDGSGPAVIRDGDEVKVLVDTVPDCPRALTELPAGALEVTYRGTGGSHLTRLPLPIEGSLPRLVQRRCSATDRL
jgi:hypothetical protein